MPQELPAVLLNGEAVVAEVTESPRVDGCLYWDDKVIAFRGRTPRARSAESCCGADIVQAYAAPYPIWMINKVLGTHRKNRKVSRVLQIAVKYETLQRVVPCDHNA